MSFFFFLLFSILICSFQMFQMFLSIQSQCGSCMKHYVNGVITQFCISRPNIQCTCHSPISDQDQQKRMSSHRFIHHLVHPNQVQVIILASEEIYILASVISMYKNSHPTSFIHNSVLSIYFISIFILGRMSPVCFSHRYMILTWNKNY